jgi:hypothetical protein
MEGAISAGGKKYLTRCNFDREKIFGGTGDAIIFEKKTM